MFDPRAKPIATCSVVAHLNSAIFFPCLRDLKHGNGSDKCAETGLSTTIGRVAMSAAGSGTNSSFLTPPRGVCAHLSR